MPHAFGSGWDGLWETSPSLSIPEFPRRCALETGNKWARTEGVRCRTGAKRCHGDLAPLEGSTCTELGPPERETPESILVPDFHLPWRFGCWGYEGEPDTP